MSFLLQFGARTLVVVWTLICLVLYVLAEVLGEAIVELIGGVAGGVIGGAFGFVHDIAMVLLVLVWVGVAWVLWRTGKNARG